MKRIGILYQCGQYRVFRKETLLLYKGAHFVDEGNLLGTWNLLIHHSSTF